MAKFTVFTEKDVRNSILKKANVVNINKDGAHWTGDIEYNNKVFSFIKIPNPHNKSFWEGKAKNTAKQLMLNPSQYNEFVKCSMKPKEYLDIISSAENK
jgi:hypothetical protein